MRQTSKNPYTETYFFKDREISISLYRLQVGVVEGTVGPVDSSCVWRRMNGWGCMVTLQERQVCYTWLLFINIFLVKAGALDPSCFGITACRLLRRS